MKTHSEYSLISSPSASFLIGNPVLTSTRFSDCVANSAASVSLHLWLRLQCVKGSGSPASACLDVDWNEKQARIW